MGLAWTPSCNRRRMRSDVSHEGLQEGEKPKVAVGNCRLRSKVQSEEEGGKRYSTSTFGTITLGSSCQGHNLTLS